jgi:superfamily II DNA or RNA helicase
MNTKLLSGPQVLPVKENGLFYEVNSQTLVDIGQKGIWPIVNASTIRVMEPGETPQDPPRPIEIPLWSMDKGILRFPKGVAKTLQTELEIEKSPLGENIPLCLKPTERFPIQLEETQKEILKTIREKNQSGIIEAAMGAGKSWILLALVLGHPLLRPAAISGKGEKDTKQLLEKIRKLYADHPQYAEPIILSGLGRSLSKKDKALLSEGEGIIVCTHAGLQNLPPNTQLLILDEVHAAATPKRIGKILALKSLKKAFGLTGTAGLRGDGGDKLLETLIGETLCKKTHAAFEATGRVAPAKIQAYHFHGRGIYAENPFIPDQMPLQGYSLHATWIENHRGRHEFTADLLLHLPHNETKVVFVPHILHAVRIMQAVEKKLHENYGDYTPEERENLKPVIFHANANKTDKFHMSKEERERRVKALEEGKIKLAISTDFLATGFDTNMIDHIIDASGQKAIINNIQRSGRGIRPRTLPNGSPKVNQIHTILDKTHPVLHKIGEKRFAALCAYYNHQEGIPNSERLGGAFRYQEPPWVPQQDRATKLGISPHTQTPESSFDPWRFRKT